MGLGEPLNKNASTPRLFIRGPGQTMFACLAFISSINFARSDALRRFTTLGLYLPWLTTTPCVAQQLRRFGEGDAEAPVLDADGASEQVAERGVRVGLGGLIGGGGLWDIGHEFRREVGLARDG